MATNFDFLLKDKKYEMFAESAIEAEKSLSVSPATAAILTRRALELAVKWLYANDFSLRLPYRDTLSSLIYEETFQETIEPSLFPLLKNIVKLGNSTVHTNQKVKRDAAILALRDLYEFCKWIDYCYGETYEDTAYNESLLEPEHEKKVTQKELQELYENLDSKDQSLEEVRNENQKLQEELRKLRAKHEAERSYQVDPYTEAETRKKYIDVELIDAGWSIGNTCRKEVKVTGMPNASGVGYADYVLYGDDGKPLAVVEAKKTSVDIKAGSYQAKLYADCLQNETGQRPLIFVTNGFEIEFMDDFYDMPRRKVSGFFTKNELQLYIDRRTHRKPLKNIEINDKITNRPYQKEAILAICDAIDKKRRQMLIVQATGSGKTRVSISLVDVLRRYNYVKNILFLADRTALVKQAKRNFSNLLPDLSLCNLLENKEDPEQCRMIFSTYPTMMNAIDEKKTKDGKRLFTPGHFDLIIIDESHRSIYRKYQEIFQYFDAMLLGMTATPKDEIDRNTYAIFDLERGVPTYAYELKQAVEEKYLVDYSTLEYKTKIMEDGIHYQDLSEEEKDEFELKFEDDPGIDKDISNTAVNQWLFNSDTIDLVLKELMEKGLKVEGGDKLGKTIIFAKNSRHAALITERFRKLYAEYGDSFIEQIDYSIRYVDKLIDDFSSKDKMPQIAVSVDMLDTGIDVPEVLNLVFFKKVRSYAKFWQMIGRGTRLCPDLFGAGQDKTRFLIFDFCNNFDFFRADPHGTESKLEESLTEKIFLCKARILRELQGAAYQADASDQMYRKQLEEELWKQVCALDLQSFRIKQHLRYVESYRDKKSWENLNTDEVNELKEHIAPLMTPTVSDELARRFDHLMLSIELAELESKNAKKNMVMVTETARQLSALYRIPEVAAQKSVIEAVKDGEYWTTTDINQMEQVRVALRSLVHFLEKERQKIYYTDFTDNIVEAKEGESLLDAMDLKSYREKVEFYLREHQDVTSVFKLRHNKKMTTTEFSELERILWQELGSKADYQKEYGETPIGLLVRKIVGVEREAVNEAFREFLSEHTLNLYQLRFVNLIIDYIVVNGNLEDNSVLMQEPFKSAGRITVLFKDNMAAARKLLEISADIKKNCEATA